MRYIGQTGRSFRVRFQEHFRDFKYGNNKSKLAMHLLENKHSIGHIEDITKMLYKTNKYRLMNTTNRNVTWLYIPYFSINNARVIYTKKV